MAFDVQWGNGELKLDWQEGDGTILSVGDLEARIGIWISCVCDRLGDDTSDTWGAVWHSVELTSFTVAGSASYVVGSG